MLIPRPVYHEYTKKNTKDTTTLCFSKRAFVFFVVLRALREEGSRYENVAMTGAWSLVPMSVSTGQLVAVAASDVLAKM